MAYFHFRLDGPRPTFPFDMTEVEKEAMGRHSLYWRQRAAERAAIVVGPVMNGEGAYGMAVIEADTEKAATAIGAADPVILAGLGFRFTISSMPSIILRQN